MVRKIAISAGKVTVEAELNDSPTASAIFAALPIQAEACTWGLEVYFRIPVRCGAAEDAREEMKVGEIGYWPPGSAMCIFFGRTPASGRDGEPKAASPVNPIGRVTGDASALRSVREDDPIVVARAT